MKHETPQFFPDEHGIGQKRIAEIRAELAMQEMGNAAPDAFDVGRVNEEWRAMKRRIFYRNRAEYERAKAILEVLQ